MSRLLRNWTFWTAISLLIITNILFIGTTLEHFNFSSIIGQYRLNHWTGWIGTIFIAIHIPIFVWAKRKHSKKIRTFLTIHVIGMLSSYLLITIHFASQISRPAEFYPDLGTGVAQYIFMIILTITGFLQRFNLISKHRKKWLFLHRSSIFAVLIIIIFHILHGS